MKKKRHEISRKEETHSKNDDSENTDCNKKNHLIVITTILELPIGVHPPISCKYSPPLDSLETVKNSCQRSFKFLGNQQKGGITKDGLGQITTVARMSEGQLGIA